MRANCDRLPCFSCKGRIILNHVTCVFITNPDEYLFRETITKLTEDLKQERFRYLE